MAIIKLSAESQNLDKHYEEVQKCRDWFELDKDHKAAITDEFEEMYKLYKGDHWDLTGPTGQIMRTPTQKKSRPNSVENISFALIEGLVAEFAEEIQLIDYPQNPQDEYGSAVMTDIKKFLFYKNKFHQERSRWLRYFFSYGTGIWHPFWDPSWRGGKGPNHWEGEIRITAPHPKSIFPDARCFQDIEEGRRIHKAYYPTQEYIKEKFDVEVDEDLIDDSLIIGDELGTLTTAEEGEGRALLVETWYKGEPLITEKGESNDGIGLHVIWWAGEEGKYLGHDNYVYYEPDEDPVFPFNFKVRYPRENSVWGFGELYALKHPQITLNKTAELIIEGHMQSAIGQTLFMENAFTPRQRKMIEEYGNMPGVWIPAKDPNAVNRLYGQGVPESLPGETSRLQNVMETLVGRFDISQGRTPGSVTAFRALDLLAARAQVRLRSAEETILEGYQELGTYTNNLITLCYTEKRAYRILGEDRRDDDQEEGKEEQRPKYGTYDPTHFRKVYFYGPPSVDWSWEEFEEWGGPDHAALEGYEEGEHYEIYSPQYDSFCKASTTMPSDRMFYLEIAKELFGTQLIDEETFWYVMDRGKFPPYEDLKKKSEERRQQQEQMMQQEQQAMQQQQQQEQQAVELDANAEAQAQSDQAIEEATAVHLEALFAAHPDTAEQFLSLSEDEQMNVINLTRQSMQQGHGGSR